MLVFLFTWMIPSLMARNFLTPYRPFDWRYVKREIGDSCYYELWYPQRMEHLAAATQAIIDQIYEDYSHQVFTDFHWLEDTLYDAVKRDTVFHEVAEDESTATLAQPQPKTYQIWYDKKREIFVFPSLQDFTQQKLSYGVTPPGVLGFNETLNWRVGVPYPGSYVLYKNVLYHELAHAWMFQFVREALEHSPNRKDYKRNLFISFPLWYIEGWAELLNRDFNQDYDQSYLAVMRENAMRRQVCDLQEGVPSCARMMGLDVYSFGYSMLHWVKVNYGMDKLIELLARRPGYNSFAKAWLAVFEETVEETEEKWLIDLRYDNFRKVYADGKTELLPRIRTADTLAGYANYHQNKLAYYARDKKWQVKVLVEDLVTKERWDVHHIFEDKSLWYRGDNPPAIHGNIVAQVVNKEGQDELQIYSLEKEGQIERLKILRMEEILTINNPRFSSSGRKIVFEGIAPNGFSDLYLWDIPQAKIFRLTNDIYHDFEPCFAPNEDIIIFASDRLVKERTGLYALDLRYGRIFCLYQPEGKATFADQPIVNPANGYIAFRRLTIDHSPQIYVWHRGQIYCVRSTFEGVSQIIGWTDEQTLLLRSNQGKAVELTVDQLENYPQSTVALKTIPVRTWSPDQPDRVIEPTALQGRKYRHAMPIGMQGFGLSSPTGEEILAINAEFAAAISKKRQAFFYKVSVQKIDLRQRLQKSYSIQAYRNYLFRSVDQHLHRTTVLDHTFRAGVNYYWPFDLENGIGFNVGGGYLKRGYPQQIDYKMMNPSLAVDKKNFFSRQGKRDQNPYLPDDEQ